MKPFVNVLNTKNTVQLHAATDLVVIIHKAHRITEEHLTSNFIQTVKLIMSAVYSTIWKTSGKHFLS